MEKQGIKEQNFIGYVFRIYESLIQQHSRATISKTILNTPVFFRGIRLSYFVTDLRQNFVSCTQKVLKCSIHTYIYNEVNLKCGYTKLGTNKIRII